MDGKCYLFLGIVLCLAIILESRVIVPRNPDEEIPLSINPLEKDNDLGLKPAIWGPPAGDTEYFDNSEGIDPARRPLKNDYDYKLEGDVDEEDNRPGTNRERFPINADREEKPDEKDYIDNSDDENFINPHGVSDPAEDDKTVNEKGDESEVGDIAPKESEEENNDKGHKPEDEGKFDEERKEDESVEDDNNKEHKPEDEEELKNDSNDKAHKSEDEEKPDEERKEEEEEEKYEPENDDGKKYVPEEESTIDEKKEADGAIGHEDDKNGDENIPQEGERGFFSGGSIFDTPFFNLEQVKNYFSKLDRALGHVFRQTLDEALLLNGTYANTTEEEVDIDGKKYIVTKSVLKGADNNSMMYVEALSTKPKMDDSEVVQDIDIKNATSS